MRQGKSEHGESDDTKSQSGMFKSIDDVQSHPLFEGLSSAQEALISRYADHSLGFVGRFRVGRLLQTNAAAKNFLESLESSRGAIRGLLQVHDERHHLSPAEVENLWTQIGVTLSQEEHAALLARRGMLTHGELRSETGNRSELLTDWWMRVRWGLSGAASGAALSAAAVFMIVSPASQVVSPGVGFSSGPVAVGGPQLGGPQQVAHLSIVQGRHMEEAAVQAGDRHLERQVEAPSIIGASSPSPSRSGISTQGASQQDGLPQRAARIEQVSSDARAAELSSGDELSRREYTENQYDMLDLSDAIALALEERARRETSAGQGLMSARTDGRAGGLAGGLAVKLNQAEAVSAAGQVRDGQSSRARAPQASGRIPQAIEVDWMKSQGRVQLFHDPVEKAAYIWISPSRRMVSQAPVGVE